MEHRRFSPVRSRAWPGQGGHPPCDTPARSEGESRKKLDPPPSKPIERRRGVVPPASAVEAPDAGQGPRATCDRGASTARPWSRSYSVGVGRPDEWDALARSMKRWASTRALAKDCRPRLREPHATALQDFLPGAPAVPDLRPSTTHPLAFGGRILPGEEGPKYKNSYESPDLCEVQSRTLYATQLGQGPRSSAATRPSSVRATPT